MTPQTPTILMINSSGRAAGSVSRALSQRLATRLVATTGATLTERDVATGLPLVNESWIGSNFTPKPERTAEQRVTLAMSDTLVAELRAADILLIGMPVYNFGIPAALKIWVDMVCRVGETFRYGAAGPEGLLTGKRAYVTMASGGVPLGAPVDHASPYLTQVLNFIGITDITYIAAAGTGDETVVQAANAEIDALSIPPVLQQLAS